MLDILFEALKSNNVNLWIMYNHENSDEYFCKYISNMFATASITFVTPFKIYLVIHELDSNNAKVVKFPKDKVEILTYSNSDELQEIIEEIVSKLLFPNKVMLSYSTMSDSNTDILGHGEYLFITKKIKNAYKKYNKLIKFISAEKIIYDIGTVKTDLELQRMKLLAKITNRILEAAFLEIRIGMSEIEISELTRNITEEVMNMYIDSNDILDYDFAWNICPIVLTGKNLTLGGHSLPSVKLLKPGETIYFDFGIKVFFKDKMVLNTDMQRMGYALKQGEKTPPKEVLKVFNTLVDAIDSGMEAMKSGVKAYKIDDIVRKKIVKAGYQDYNHATGHAVGKEVHDVGAVISTKNNRRANLCLSNNSVYTLEPRIAIPNGGSIEEMIQVTKYGGIPLCDVQKKLYIVK